MKDTTKSDRNVTTNNWFVELLRERARMSTKDAEKVDKKLSQLILVQLPNGEIGRLEEYRTYDRA